MGNQCKVQLRAHETVFVTRCGKQAHSRRNHQSPAGHARLERGLGGKRLAKENGSVREGDVAASVRAARSL